MAGSNTLARDYTPPADIEPLVAGLLTTLHERHVDMADLVGGLPAGALDWRPGPEMNSLAGLALHILEDEEFVARVAAGESLSWHGENGSSLELTADEARVVAAIEAVDALLKQVLPGLPAARYGDTQPGEDRTIGSALIEEFDHSAMHYGQMQLTRHLFELAHPRAPTTYKHWR